MEPERKHPEDIPGRDRAEAERATERETRRLLRDLVGKAVPPVPRKLNRVGELFGLCLDVARENSWRMIERKEQLTLLRLVILQLLAPDLYRFGRHNPAFLSKLETWGVEYTKQANLSLIEDAIRVNIRKNEEVLKNKQSKPDEAQTAVNDLYTARRLDQPLLDLVRTAQQHRSRFDPLKLLDSDNPCDSGIHRYFNLEHDLALPPAPTDLVATILDDADDRTPAAPSDPDGFFNQLFSSDEIAWRNAIEQEAERLNGHVLDNASFQSLLDRVRRAPRVVSVRWLEQLDPYLNAGQLVTLYRESQLLQRLNDSIQGAPS